MKSIPTILLLPKKYAPIFAVAKQPSALPATDPHDAAPVAYSGMKVQVDMNGVQSVGYRVNRDYTKPSPWLVRQCQIFADITAISDGCASVQIHLRNR